MLLILTQVDNVKINFGTPNEINLDEVDIKSLEEYRKDNHFKAGSMLPKVNASINFVKERKNAVAIITSIKEAYDAVCGKAGTRIVNHD